MSNAPDESRCDKSSPASGIPASEHNPWSSPGAEEKPRSYTLIILCLLIVMVAAVWVVTVYSPPLGLGLAVLLTPIVIWIWLFLKRGHELEKEKLDFNQKLMRAVETVFYLGIACFAAGIAFSVSCSAVNMIIYQEGPRDGMKVGLFAWISGIVSGVAVLFCLLNKFWGEHKIF